MVLCRDGAFQLLVISISLTLMEQFELAENLAQKVAFNFLT